MRRDFRLYLEENEVDEFGAWAFGDDLKELQDPLDFMKAWNVLHQFKLKLKSDGSIYDDIPKMVDLWRNRNDKTI